MKKLSKIGLLVLCVAVVVGIGGVVLVRYFPEHSPDMHSFFHGLHQSLK